MVCSGASTESVGFDFGLLRGIFSRSSAVPAGALYPELNARISGSASSGSCRNAGLHAGSDKSPLAIAAELLVIRKRSGISWTSAWRARRRERREDLETEVKEREDTRLGLEMGETSTSATVSML